MKLLMEVNKADSEMVEVWRETKMGLQFLAIMHSDSFEGELLNALFDENSRGFVEVSLEVVK